MNSNIILLLILAFTAFSRLFLIDKIPPVLYPTVLNSRLLSAAASIGSIFLIFLLTKSYFQNHKIAFLTSWVFSILPWTIEQGRIVSQPNVALFSILLFLLLTKRYSNSGFKASFLYIFIPLILIFVYPQFWLFKVREFNFNITSFINNIFILFSFDFLFFKNITFWWGGVKEFGIMFQSFLPFFAVGIYKLIISKGKKLFILLIFAVVIAALSPFFPESREFYLSTPLLSLTVALGIYYICLQKKFSIRILFACIFIVVLYELSQFYHFYFIHYPQEVRGNFSQIHESF